MFAIWTWCQRFQTCAYVWDLVEARIVWAACADTAIVRRLPSGGRLDLAIDHNPNDPSRRIARIGGYDS